MATPFFFFRPVLAADNSWAAFDWQSSDRATTYGADYLRCFSSAAVAPLANTMPLIVSVSPDDLGNAELIDTFEASQVILVLPSAVLDDKKAMEHCRKLSGQGYRFGLDVDNTEILKKIPVSDFDSVRFDAAFARQELSALNLMYLNDAGFRKIATDVGTHEMFGWLQENGFELYGSHFLTARNPAAGKEPDLTRLKLLKLLNIVKQDGDTREIEAIFREEPKLSYNLLRLVNSVAVGARTKISSFSQAIAILGRRQLQRWLQLLIYTNPKGGRSDNPLLQLAATRGRMMELLAERVTPRNREFADQGFMVGIMSLMPALLGVAIEEILAQLPVAPRVQMALVDRTGLHGQLLQVVEATEQTDPAILEEALQRVPGIGLEFLEECLTQALFWAYNLGREKADD